MKNKFSSYLYWILAVFPFILSAAFYSRLPEQVVVQWDSAGEPSNYASRPFAAFGIPAILLFAALYVNFSIFADPQKRNIDRSPQLKLISRWAIIVLANVGQAVTIFNATNHAVNPSVFFMIFVGVLIAVVGNYLPKCKYNYTIGIKLPWTLSSEENWRKTHRFAGFVWIIGGAMMAVCAFLPFEWLVLTIIALLVVMPAAYSFLIFQKDKIERLHDEK